MYFLSLLLESAILLLCYRCHKNKMKILLTLVCSLNFEIICRSLNKNLTFDMIPIHSRSARPFAASLCVNIDFPIFCELPFFHAKYLEYTNTSKVYSAKLH